MFKYLLTPEGQRVVAFYTIVIILIAFALGAHPFKKTKKVVPSAQWTASDYYMYVRACILSCATIDQLDQMKPLVESYYDKHFRVPITTNERKRYYGRLLEAVSKKETELNKCQVIA
jgi:hypothetical protein